MTNTITFELPEELRVQLPKHAEGFTFNLGSLREDYLLHFLERGFSASLQDSCAGKHGKEAFAKMQARADAIRAGTFRPAGAREVLQIPENYADPALQAGWEAIVGKLHEDNKARPKASRVPFADLLAHGEKLVAGLPDAKLAAVGRAELARREQDAMLGGIKLGPLG